MLFFFLVIVLQLESNIILSLRVLKKKSQRERKTLPEIFYFIWMYYILSSALFQNQVYL